MMAPAARALEKYQGLETAESNAMTEKFSDRKEIAKYAVQSYCCILYYFNAEYFEIFVSLYIINWI